MTLAPKGPVLVLLPDRNSPPAKDFTGAFKPSADVLKATLKATVVQVQVPVVDPATLTIAAKDKQALFEKAAQSCIDAIRQHKPAHLVFMCHGWASGLQLGFRTKKQKGADVANLDALLKVLDVQQVAGTLHSICLFACSAGDEPASADSSPGTGDDSIADYIRDQTGVPVLAHWTVGHATRNPDLIFFDASNVPLVGGTAIQRGTALHRNAQRLLCSSVGGKPNSASMRPPQGDVRPAWTSLPLCTSYAELHALLSQEPG